jgi:hypothetical protein
MLTPMIATTAAAADDRGVGLSFGLVVTDGIEPIP